MRSFLIMLWAIIPLMGSAQIGSKVKSAGNNEIEGIWENNEFGFNMVLMLNPGGKGEFDGETIQYKISDNLLSIITATGTTIYQYNLTGNKLLLTGGDLEKPVTFSRGGTSASADGNISSPGNTNTIMPSDNLVGKWESNTESLEFKNNGMAIIQGVNMSYSVSGNNLTIQSPNGTQSFAYSIQGDFLTVNINGQNQMFKRSGSQSAQGNPGYSQGSAQSLGGQPNTGVIAQELVGKWCYLSNTSSGSGGWSTDECIIINGDGTYEYNYESSGSASGYNQYGDQTFAGGTANQSSDRGTWKLAGSTLYVQSQAKGAMTLTLQKVNNPKNGDPMIVINGRSYVTFYQKPGW